MYHYTDGSLHNVWLTNGYVERDTPYGKAVSFHDLDGLINAICQALVSKPGKLTGAEFRYIRTAMLLSQKSFGQMVGYTEQAVAKWEKTGKVPKAIDAVMRMVYSERQYGNQNACSMVDMLNALDRASQSTIIVSKEGSHWQSRIEEVELEAA